DETRRLYDSGEGARAWVSTRRSESVPLRPTKTGGRSHSFTNKWRGPRLAVFFVPLGSVASQFVRAIFDFEMQGNRTRDETLSLSMQASAECALNGAASIFSLRKPTTSNVEDDRGRYSLRTRLESCQAGRASIPSCPQQSFGIGTF